MLTRTGCLKAAPMQKLPVWVYECKLYSYRTQINVNGGYWNTCTLVFTMNRQIDAQIGTRVNVNVNAVSYCERSAVEQTQCGKNENSFNTEFSSIKMIRYNISELMSETVQQHIFTRRSTAINIKLHTVMLLTCKYIPVIMHCSIIKLKWKCSSSQTGVDPRKIAEQQNESITVHEQTEQRNHHTHRQICTERDFST